jgi:hypothetical protein
MNWKNDWLHFGTPVAAALLSEGLNLLQGENALTWQAAVRALLMAALSALALVLKSSTSQVTS